VGRVRKNQPVRIRRRRTAGAGKLAPV